MLDLFIKFLILIVFTGICYFICNKILFYIRLKKYERTLKQGEDFTNEKKY